MDGPDKDIIELLNMFLGKRRVVATETPLHNWVESFCADVEKHRFSNYTEVEQVKF